jgi:hypothetical protein
MARFGLEPGAVGFIDTKTVSILFSIAITVF